MLLLTEQSELTTRCGACYKTKIMDIYDLRECIVDKWDKLDQCIIDTVVEEWRNRLRACVAEGGGQLEHKM